MADQNSTPVNSADLSALLGPSQQDLQNLPTSSPGLSPALNPALASLGLGNQVNGGGTPAAPPTMDEVQHKARQNYNQLLAGILKPYYPDANTDTGEIGKPSTKTRILEVLRALTSPRGTYETPMMRARDIADKQFGLETQRVNSLDQLGRVYSQLGIAQDKLAEEKRNHDLQMTAKQNMVDYLTNKEKDMKEARGFRNDILQQNANSLTDLRGSQQTVNEFKAQIAAYHAAHPGLDLNQLREVFMEESDPNKRKALLEGLSQYQLGAAAGQLIPKSSSTSTTYENGIPTSVNTLSQKVPLPGMMNPQGPAPLTSQGTSSLANMMPQPGGPQAPAAQSPAATPQAPSQAPTPQVTPPALVRPPVRPAARPQTPPAPANGNPIGNALDIMSGQTAMPGHVANNFSTNYQKDLEKRNESILALDRFGVKANMGIENLQNAMATGASKNFQGALQGNPLAVDLRNYFGKTNSNEALNALEQIELLYGKLGVNVRGRFTVPEIQGHLRTMGTQSMTPENALQKMMALKYQMQVDRMFLHGDIKPGDATAIGGLVRNEMDRVMNVMKTLTPQEQAQAALGQIPSRARVQDMDTLWAQSKAQAASPAGISADMMDRVNAEVARRKAAKKP